MHQNHELPLVSIGMPVYNGGPSTRAAIESILTQTYRNFELIVSDNASTDETESICREMAARDARISYSRNAVNEGPCENFKKVLVLARGEYFMWAAHDDYCKPQFVEANLRELLKDPKVICSMSQVLLSDGKSLSAPTLFNPAGTFPLMSTSPSTNLLKYLFLPGLNARFYGLWRREVVLKTIQFDDYCSADVAFIARALVHGKFAEVKQRLWIRGGLGVSSNSMRLLCAGERSFVDRLVPLNRFNNDLMQVKEIRRSPVLLAVLTILNLYFCGWKYKTLAVNFVQRILGRAP
jgi:glycosyltransferase involved in cell wall biosynthesis